MTLSGGRKTLRTRRLRVALRCSERCAATIRARLIEVRRLATRHRDLLAGRRTVVTLKLSRATMRKLRRRLGHHSFVRIGVTVRAADAAGNATQVTRHGRIKRRRQGR